MTPGARLRELLAGEALVVAPGAYDCLTARMVEQAGFPAVYMTGAGTAASLGYPDYGLVTMSEMAANAARIAAAVAAPVIADADTGFGNELNVVRTVREYAAAGVAGLHIEDQVFPKRCGHLDRKAGDRGRGVRQQGARGGRESPGSRSRADCAHRRACCARLRGGCGAGESRAAGWGRRGLRGGAADPGGAGRGSSSRRGTVPVERGRRRQDARHRPGAGGGARLSAGDRSRAGARSACWPRAMPRSLDWPPPDGTPTRCRSSGSSRSSSAWARAVGTTCAHATASTEA